MRTTRSRSLWSASVALGLLVYFQGSTLAWSQDFQYFGISDISGYLEVGYKYRDQKRERSTAQSSTQLEEMELNQRLHLNLDGYSLHPRFLEYHLGGDLTNLWQRVDTDGESSSSSDVLTGGNLEITLLKDHPYTFNAYASRSEVETDQLFTLSYTAPRTTYGASASLKRGALPFTIRYDHAEVEGDAGASDLSEESDRYTFISNYHIGGRSKGNIRAFLNQVDQTSFGQSTEQRQLNLSNVTFLDNAQKLRLDGHLHMASQTGIVDSSTRTIRETLHWKHSDNFYTRYGVNFDQIDIDSNRTRIQSGQFSLNHKLYQSLTTNIELNSSSTVSSEQKTTVERAQLSENYTKRVGKEGIFSLNASAFAETFDINPRDDTIEVNDEALVLNGTVTVALAQIDVLLSSIRVTDSRGITQYVEGTDYAVSTIGNTVFIARLFLGTIPDGDTVLVTYRFDAGLAREIRTLGGSLRAQISKGDTFLVYGQLERSRQSLLSGSPVDTLENLKREAYGMQGGWGLLDFGVDYEKRLSTFTPNRSFSQYVSVSGRPFARANVSANVTHQRQVYLDSREEVESWNLHGIVNSELTRRTGLELDAEYRRQRWSPKSLGSGNEAYGMRGSLYWRYRGLSAELSGLYSQINQASENEERTRIELRVRRDF